MIAVIEARVDYFFIEVTKYDPNYLYYYYWVGFPNVQFLIIH